MSEYMRLKKRMSKKTLAIIVSSILVTLALAVGMPVTQVSALNGNTFNKLAQRASASAEKQENELSRIQKRADQMITVRLTTLQNLLSRVQNDKRLTTDEKTSFESDINITVANLTALKAKIDADTDGPTALSDAKSIVTSYRIYMVFEPKMRLLVIIDNLQTASGTIASLVTKVQGLLDQLKSEGKDTTGSQTALNDVTTQLNTINTTLTTDKALLEGVQVGSTDPQSVFVQVRKDLANVRSEFAKIRNDFATVRTQIQIILPKGEATIKPSSASQSAE